MLPPPPPPPRNHLIIFLWEWGVICYPCITISIITIHTLMFARGNKYMLQSVQSIWRSQSYLHQHHLHLHRDRQCRHPHHQSHQCLPRHHLATFPWKKWKKTRNFVLLLVLVEQEEGTHFTVRAQEVCWYMAMNAKSLSLVSSVAYSFFSSFFLTN